jgi:hypothetical protein
VETISVTLKKKGAVLKIAIAVMITAPAMRLTELAALTVPHQNQILPVATGTPSVTTMKTRIPVRVIVRDQAIAAVTMIASLI